MITNIDTIHCNQYIYIYIQDFKMEGEVEFTNSYKCILK